MINPIVYHYYHDYENNVSVFERKGHIQANKQQNYRSLLGR